MAAQKISIGKTTSTASRFGPFDVIETTGGVLSGGPERGKPKRSTNVAAFEQVDSAVLAHLRAMRTLGNTTANSLQIARALSLDKATVEKALDRLKGQGVKARAR
jgi:hypothetical protein